MGVAMGVVNAKCKILYKILDLPLIVNCSLNSLISAESQSAFLVVLRLDIRYWHNQ